MKSDGAHLEQEQARRKQEAKKRRDEIKTSVEKLAKDIADAVKALDRTVRIKRGLYGGDRWDVTVDGHEVVEMKIREEMSGGFYHSNFTGKFRVYIAPVGINDYRFERAHTTVFRSKKGVFDVPAIAARVIHAKELHRSYQEDAAMRKSLYDSISARAERANGSDTSRVFIEVEQADRPHAKPRVHINHPYLTIEQAEELLPLIRGVLYREPS